MDSSFCLFERLPAEELNALIFDRLNVIDLRVFAMVSARICEKIGLEGLPTETTYFDPQWSTTQYKDTAVVYRGQCRQLLIRRWQGNVYAHPLAVYLDESGSSIEPTRYFEYTFSVDHFQVYGWSESNEIGFMLQRYMKCTWFCSSLAANSRTSVDFAELFTRGTVRVKHVVINRLDGAEFTEHFQTYLKAAARLKWKIFN